MQYIHFADLEPFSLWLFLQGDSHPERRLLAGQQFFFSFLRGKGGDVGVESVDGFCTLRNGHALVNFFVFAHCRGRLKEEMDGLEKSEI